jgi:hypothetical protein
MVAKIFISYRRDESRYQARMIYDALLRALPHENVFIDIDTIPVGVDFARVLDGWVEQTDAVLVLLGKDWANSTDPKTGTRRLDNPKDFVRIEVRGALTRDVLVVPVLLDGAQIPNEAELPDDIKGLLSRNAEFVDYRTFDTDVQRLLKKLGVGGSAKEVAVIPKPRDRAIALVGDWTRRLYTSAAAANERAKRRNRMIMLLMAAAVGAVMLLNALFGVDDPR